MFGQVGHLIGNESWFAGGGSGGGESGAPALPGKGGGGQGGWGNGSQTPAGLNGEAGKPNTGGGGGGGNNQNGGIGGSGIVIVRYSKKKSELSYPYNGNIKKISLQLLTFICFHF